MGSLKPAVSGPHMFAGVVRCRVCWGAFVPLLVSCIVDWCMANAGLKECVFVDWRRVADVCGVFCDGVIIMRGG